MKKSAVILRTLKYLFRHKILLTIVARLTVSSNLLALVAPSLSGKAIDAIVEPGNVDYDTVFLNCALMLGFYVISALLGFANSVVMINLSRKVVYTMRKQVFEHLVDMPVGYFDKNQTGDLISRLTYDIDTINASLSNDLVQICAGSITVVGSAIMMYNYAPILMLVFLITIPTMIGITIHRMRKVKPLFRRRSAMLGELNGYTEEMLSGQKTIRAYGKEKVMIGRFDKHNDEAIDAYYMADYHGSVIGPSVNLINNLSLSLISMFGAILYIFTPSFTLGSLSSFVLYSRKFSGPVNETANIISEIQSASSAAERVFRLLDSKTENLAGPSGNAPEKIRGEIDIDNISFGYDEGKPILKNISAHIPAGSTVAVVGPTGSGKTTIINLLMRFYDVQSGEIRIDGVNTADMSLGEVRRSFAMVLQDTWLFTGTIAQNIAYGTQSASREEIENAARAAGVHDFILSLPDGYETIVDENGVNISKGQKQLITIARAILMNCPMLILDEATSNVDTRTEIQLQRAMDAVMQGKTNIVVAHRLSTIQNADKILVIKDGVLIESGTHDELLKLDGGFYRSLYYSQFSTSDKAAAGK